MQTEFMTFYKNIPATLPSSLLVCPPSAAYLKQYTNNGGSNTARVETASSPTRELVTQYSERRITTAANYGSNPRQQAFAPMTASSTARRNIQKPATLQNMFEPVKSSNNAIDESNITSAPSIWVKKWVDYSQKYGLGYLLSNGAAGVFFNDSTKIILQIGSTSFDYLERRVSDKQEIIHRHTLDNYPQDIHKKVTLLQHFKSYLEGDGKKPMVAPIKQTNKEFLGENENSEEG